MTLSKNIPTLGPHIKEDTSHILHKIQVMMLKPTIFRPEKQLKPNSKLRNDKSGGIYDYHYPSNGQKKCYE